MPDHGIQGAVLILGQTAAFNPRVCRMCYPIFQYLDQARLPNPGLATHQHHVAHALFHLGPAFPEHANLLLSTNEWCETSGGRDFQATLCPALPRNAIDMERRCYAS